MDLAHNKKFSIAFAYPHNGQFNENWIDSYAALLIHEVSKPKEMRILGSILKSGSCYVDGNRNIIVKQLRNNTQDDWVLMVDTDISFAPDIMEKFARHIMTNPKVRIIAGRANLLNGMPVFYNVGPAGHKSQPFAFEGIKAFDLVGTGIICIHRKAFDKIEKGEGHPHFFNKIISSEKISIGDDFSFCMRSKRNGLKVYGAWDIKGIHWKNQPCPQAYPEIDKL